ncbi:MAG: hypothetical protein IJV15_12385 [Lachnospiraceae bacterium]|nr:hypothetical protein [Lachnospiraceae bacterium]
MILLITNKDDVTVDYVVRELRRQQLPYYRLNTEEIPEKVYVDFNFTTDVFCLRDNEKDSVIDLGQVTSVYFRRPRITNLSHIESELDSTEKYYLQREAAQILEGIYKILESRYWINNVYRIREAENKIHQLRLAKEIGFITPDTILSNSSDRIKDFFNTHSRDCIIKPVRSGGMGDESGKVIFTSKLERVPADGQIESFPLYLQNRIEKAADLRIVTIGERVYCAMIESQTDSMAQIDWRRARGTLEHTEHILPVSIQEMCKEITKRLGLIYSAIDMVLTQDDNYVFLECNPNGQWAWLEERLGFPISCNIVKLLSL